MLDLLFLGSAVNFQGMFVSKMTYYVLNTSGALNLTNQLVLLLTLRIGLHSVIDWYSVGHYPVLLLKCSSVELWFSLVILHFGWQKDGKLLTCVECFMSF